jgi:putative endonuclease
LASHDWQVEAVSRRLTRQSTCAAAVEIRKRKTMRYVYILQSINDGRRHYTGVTSNLGERLKRHNRGEVAHTAKFLPWKVQTYIGFTSDEKAYAFEQYLKSGSGRAFAKKRL